jgi:hypothetical protein
MPGSPGGLPGPPEGLPGSPEGLPGSPEGLPGSPGPSDLDIALLGNMPLKDLMI